VSERLFVLGAGGYLGERVRAHLVERVGPERALVAGSAADLRACQLTRRDAVVNCAGAIGGDGSRLRAANVVLPGDVAALCAAAGARLVHVSSCAVFDGVRCGELFEGDPLRPRTAYGASKAEGEAIVRARHPTAVIVRPAKIFGGADPRGRLHTLARHVLRGRPVPTPERPRLWANFVWVDDAAAVLAALGDSGPEREIVHLTSSLAWPRFAALFADTFGARLRPFPPLANKCLGAAASLCERLPAERRSRRLDRLLEIWDRQLVVDSAERLGADSVRRGLEDLTGRVRR
jgi:dTDP-4-dehydrorhamnose reductase